MPSKAFYDAVRGPLFGGRLKQHQVEGLEKIVTYGAEAGVSRLHLAYILATVWHETAKWMQPIREGARRYGPSYSHESAVRAVTSIYSKGIIRTNYALPDGPYRQSYYGRGLVQITWHDNYRNFDTLLGVPLEKEPDRALDWDVALDILFIGMRDGLFTGKGLDDVSDTTDYRAARAIVNGDGRKYGKALADAGVHFYNALENEYGEPDCRCVCPTG